MPASSSDMVDPTKPAKYPVVLSDELMGKASREAFTGVRYNHKPPLSSDSAPSTARLKPSASSSSLSASQNGPSSFDLSFNDQGDRYAYSGTRTTDDNQYVLVFDPDRKVFVLHRLDSVFHMNLARAPGNNDAESLREEFPHLKITPSSSSGRQGAKAKGGADQSGAGHVTAKAKDARGAVVKSTGGAARSDVVDKKDKEKDKKLPPPPIALPEVKAAAPAPSSSKRRQPANEESEEESDDDDDGGLLVEYPGGEPPLAYRPSTDFSPAFPSQNRRFSDFVREDVEEEDEDADAELEDDVLEEEEEEEDNMGDSFKLPSPVNNRSSHAAAQNQGESGEDADDMDDDLEAALEKELQAASMDVDSESSVSEED